MKEIAPQKSSKNCFFRMQMNIREVEENRDELSEFEHGYLCWAKLKGYCEWPARIDYIRSSECPKKQQGPRLLAQPDFW